MDQPENFDSLDIVELVMAIEEELSHLPPGGAFGDEDDDALASLVRIIGPRKPRDQSGATAELE